MDAAWATHVFLEGAEGGPVLAVALLQQLIGSFVEAGGSVDATVKGRQCVLVVASVRGGGQGAMLVGGETVVSLSGSREAVGGGVWGGRVLGEGGREGGWEGAERRVRDKLGGCGRSLTALLKAVSSSLLSPG